MLGSGSPYGKRRSPAITVRSILIVLGIFILVVFIVDKLVLAPPPVKTAALSSVVGHLDRHDVRRVTIPARVVTLELNDGSTLTAAVPADRDLWPAIRRSGADVTIANDARPSDANASPFGVIFGFVPFVIMALLVLFILRTARGRSP